MTEKSHIYTRTGDSGTTSLVGGTRVKKNHARVQAYGTIDELNSFIGLLLATDAERWTLPEKEFLTWVQNLMFDLGAYLATDNSGNKNESSVLGQNAISRVELEIDRLDNMLPPLKAFILPGGTQQAAVAGVCRAVCRRAERDIITLNDNNMVDADVIRFVNRISDYFFILSRYLNYKSGVKETEWEKENNR